MRKQEIAKDMDPLKLQVPSDIYSKHVTDMTLKNTYRVYS